MESDVEDPAWIMTVRGPPGGLSPTSMQEGSPSTTSTSPLSSSPHEYNSVPASSTSSLTHSPPKENNGVIFREKASSPVSISFKP